MFHFQLYRHGDRTVSSSFPKDTFFDKSYWPEGYNTFLKVSQMIQLSITLYIFRLVLKYDVIVVMNMYAQKKDIFAINLVTDYSLQKVY